MTQSALLLGCVLHASLFLLAGLNKLLNYADTLQIMADAGVRPAHLLLPLVIAFEIVAGGIVGVGQRYILPAAAALAAYTLITNAFFHAFWTISGREAALQLSLFFKNIAIAGGLLYVGAAHVQLKMR